MKIWPLMAALALLPGCGDSSGGSADDSSGATANPHDGQYVDDRR